MGKNKEKTKEEEMDREVRDVERLCRAIEERGCEG